MRKSNKTKYENIRDYDINIHDVKKLSKEFVEKLERALLKHKWLNLYVANEQSNYPT